MYILLVLTPEGVENVFGMMENHMSQKATQNSKPNAIAQRKGDWQKDGAVFPILSTINCTFIIQYPRRVIEISGVVVRVRAGQR